MKSIIIAGASRCGKTMLTKRLHQEKNLIPIFSDIIIDSFKENFPALGILHGNHKETSIRLLPFLKTYLEAHSDWQQSPCVLDCAYLFPEQVVEMGFDKKYNVVFIGCPHISAEEKFKTIRTYPQKPNDWTTHFNDQTILEAAQHIVEISKTFESECKKYNLPFIDTSHDFHGNLEKAYQLTLKA